MKITMAALAISLSSLSPVAAQTYTHASRSADLTLACVDMVVPSFTTLLRIYNRCETRLRVSFCEVTGSKKPDCWEQDLESNGRVVHPLKDDWETVRKSTIWTSTCSLSGYRPGTRC